MKKYISGSDMEKLNSLHGRVEEIEDFISQISDPEIEDVLGLEDALDGKVDKVTGKALSDENYTAGEKSKLAGVASGATANNTDSHLLSRANHTGTQTASTISDFNTAVDARIEGIVGAAPAALDTLEELAAALGDDEDFAGTMTTALAGKANASHTHAISDVTNLQTALDGKAASSHTHSIANVTGLQGALDAKASSSHAHAQSDVTGLVAALSAITGRLDALETWKGLMPKRVDVYSGTTDANGDVSVTFPTGRYAAAPALFVTYLFNNNNYGTLYNVKALSNTSAQLRVHRNKNTTVGLTGGDVDPDEPLASTAIRIIAMEF